MEKEIRVKINVENMSKDTYEELLYLFRQEHGKEFFYNDWEISASKEKD